MCIRLVRFAIIAKECESTCRAKWFSNWSSCAGKAGETMVTLYSIAGRPVSLAASMIG